MTRRILRVLVLQVYIFHFIRIIAPIFAGLPPLLRFQGILNQTLWLSFAATPAATASRFDVDERFVAYLAVLCNAVYVPGSWLCTWLLRSHGLAKATHIFAVMSTLD